MGLLKLEDFGGMLPRRSERLLPDMFSQYTLNANMESGDLRGIRSPALVNKFTYGTGPQRAFRIVNASGSTTWAYTTHRYGEIVKSPLVADTLQRWYMFRPDAAPQVRSLVDEPAELLETSFHDLAIDQPTTAPVLAEGTPAGDSDKLTTRVYVYTLITSWGEESAPSPAATITLNENGVVDISGLPSGATSVSGRTIDTVRIYRSITSANSASLFFVADVAYGTTTFTDNISSATVALNATLYASSFDPPVSGLQGPRIHPSGALVAFKGKDLYFSAPYRPHAWPEDYKISFADNIVAIEVFGQQVFVMTEGRPAITYGSTPDAQGVMVFPYTMDCLSYNSVVAFPDGVMFASTYGLAMFSSSGPTIVTDQVITPKKWIEEWWDGSMRCGRAGSRYVALSENSEGFILDRTNIQNAMIRLRDVGAATGVTNDYFSSAMYFVAEDNVYEFDPAENSETEYNWVSKKFLLPRPVNFGVVQLFFQPYVDNELWYLGQSGWGSGVWLDDQPLNPDATYDRSAEVYVQVRCDGKEMLTAAVTNEERVRLTDDYKGYTWEIEVTSQCPIYRIELGDVGRGLADG